MFSHASHHFQAELPGKSLTCRGVTLEFLCPPHIPPPGWEGWSSYSRACCLMLGWKVTACKLERAAGRYLVPTSPSWQSCPEGLLTELPGTRQLCGTPEPLSGASPGAPARDWSVLNGRVGPGRSRSHTRCGRVAGPGVQSSGGRKQRSASSVSPLGTRLT